MICSFFGHRRCKKTIEPLLINTIEDLIINQKVYTFYVGTNGEFDLMVRKSLEVLKSKFELVHTYKILAYIPKNKIKLEENDDAETIYPEGLETVHPYFAIDHRNRWMAKKADFIVAYVEHDWGGAWKAVNYARNQGKTVINLADKIL